MPASPGMAAKTQQVSVRIPKIWLPKLDELAKDYSPGGRLKVTRADIVRLCIGSGMEELRKEISNRGGRRG